MKKTLFWTLILLVALQPIPVLANMETPAPATGAGCDKDSQCLSGRCIPDANATQEFGMLGVCSQGKVMQIDDMIPGPEILPGRIYLPEDKVVVIIACSGKVTTNLLVAQTKQMCFDDVVSGPGVFPGCIFLLPEWETTVTFQCRE